jgi:hypothetical protein
MIEGPAKRRNADGIADCPDTEEADADINVAVGGIYRWQPVLCARGVDHQFIAARLDGGKNESAGSIGRNSGDEIRSAGDAKANRLECRRLFRGRKLDLAGDAHMRGGSL